MISKNLMRTGRLAAAIALAFSGAASAAGSALPDDTLDEVIVTAQKRSERLIDVPISMAAITERAMRDAGASQLGEVLGTVPGVSLVDSGSGSQNINIRGINSVYGNSPVGYYLDELPFTYLGNTQLPDVRMYDVQRVELLRGPQGTLYGDGSLGGNQDAVAVRQTSEKARRYSRPAKCRNCLRGGSHREAQKQRRARSPVDLVVDAGVRRARRYRAGNVRFSEHGATRPLVPLRKSTPRCVHPTGRALPDRSH